MGKYEPTKDEVSQWIIDLKNLIENNPEIKEHKIHVSKAGAKGEEAKSDSYNMDDLIKLQNSFKP